MLVALYFMFQAGRGMKGRVTDILNGIGISVLEGNEKLRVADIILVDEQTWSEILANYPELRTKCIVVLYPGSDEARCLRTYVMYLKFPNAVKEEQLADALTEWSRD